MLTVGCIHPEILRHLSACGHGSKILIADGNYPLAEKTGSAEKIYLGVCPGVPTVLQVLRSLHTVTKFEKAEVMDPQTADEPVIFSEFRKELGEVQFEKLERFQFYKACMVPGELYLAINTGEERTFANILLTVGCA